MKTKMTFYTCFLQVNVVNLEEIYTNLRFMGIDNFDNFGLKHNFWDIILLKGPTTIFPSWYILRVSGYLMFKSHR